METEQLSETEIDNIRQGFGGMPSRVIIQRLLATLDDSTEIAREEGYAIGYDDGYAKAVDDEFWQ